MAEATVQDLVDWLGRRVRVLATSTAGLSARFTAVHRVADAVPECSGPCVLVLSEPGGTVGAAPDPARWAGPHVVAVVVAADAEPDRWRSGRADLAVLAVAPGTDADLIVDLIRAALAAGTPAADGDARAVCDLLATALGGPVAVERADTVVVAHSQRYEPDDPVRREVILTGRVPPRVREVLATTGILARLHRPQQVVEVAEGVLAPGSRRRLGAGIWAGATLVGYLWVSQPLGGWLPDARDRVVEGARLLAPLLARQALDDAGPGDPAALVWGRWLRGAAADREVAAALGCARSGTPVVAVVRPAQPWRDGAASRARAVVALHAQGLAGRAAVALDGDAVHLVAGGVDLAGVRRWAGAAVAHWDALLGQPVVVGLADAPGWPALAEARAAADRATEVLAATPRLSAALRVATVGEVREPATWRELADLFDRLPHLADPRIAVLRRYDRAHAAALVRTLRVYLDAAGDVAAAAQHLHVHPNTVRYRVRRAVQEAGLDLADPRSRALLHLHLLLADPD